MVKSLLQFIPILFGSFVVIYNIVVYFLVSFQHTVTHDGTNPEDYFYTRCIYAGVGFGAIIVALFLKYYKRK